MADDDYDDTMAYTYHDLTIIRFALRSSSSFVVLFLSVVSLHRKLHLTIFHLLDHVPGKEIDDL